MAIEDTPGLAARSLSSLWKWITSSVLGLVSGAVLVYVSPLVNNVIKPPRPVPNFSYTAEGALVTFANRSTGGTQGWWDFGDGSALEPFSPNQADVTHRFPGAGSYTVKLVLSNLIGEDADRTVALRVDPAGSNTPSIGSLKATCKSMTVPATVRVQADVKNADTILWSIDDLPLIIDDVPSGGQIGRTVTFTYYGNKTIRLVALNGKNYVEQSTEVFIEVPDELPRMLLYATEMPTRTRMLPFSVSYPETFGGDSFPFTWERTAHPGDVFVDARIDQRPNENLVRNASLVLSADRRSVKLSGELLRTKQATPSWCCNVEMKIMSAAATPTPIGDPLAKSLTLPGRTIIDLPTNFLDGKKGVQWELRQGMDVLMRDAKAPVTPMTQQVQMRGLPYRVQVQQVGSQLVIDAVGSSPAVPGTSTSTVRPN